MISYEEIDNAIDGIFIDMIDMGFLLEKKYYCKNNVCGFEILISNNNKDFKMSQLKNCSLTLSDYLDAKGEHKIKFITLNKQSTKESFNKFPIFNFKEVRKFKIIIEAIIIEAIKKSN